MPRQNFGAQFPYCGTRPSVDRECWLLFAVVVWLAAVVSWRLMDGSYHFLEASGRLLLGPMKMCMSRALKMDTRKMASDFEFCLAQFGTRLLCRIFVSKCRLFLIFPFPGIRIRSNTD